MTISEIWVNIIIPLIIGPICVFFKVLYDNYTEKQYNNKLKVYDNKYTKIKEILTKFYWPLYIKLLCIYQFNYSIPIKNEFEYISDSSDDYEYDEEINLNNKCNKCNNIIPSNCKICVKCKWNSFRDIVKNNENNNNITNIINKSDYNLENITINIPINDTDNDNYLRHKNIILDKDTIQLMEIQLNSLFKDALLIIENNMYLAGVSKKLNKNLLHFIKYCKIREIINEGSINTKYNINYFGIKNNITTLLSLLENKLFYYQNIYNSLIENGPF